MDINIDSWLFVHEFERERVLAFRQVVFIENLAARPVPLSRILASASKFAIQISLNHSDKAMILVAFILFL